MAELVSKDASLTAAATAMQAGNAIAAEECLTAHLAAHGEDPDALVMLAALRCSANRVGDGSDFLRRALAADPGHIDARLGLFDIVLAQNRVAEALDLLRQLPDAVRGTFNLMGHEAQLLGRLGRHEEEIALYHRLTAMRPDVAGVWVSMANALKTVGRTDEAVGLLRHAITLRPDYGQPWWLLSDLKNFRFDDSDLATMSRLLGDQLSAPDRIALHFALAKALEDRGQAGEAFEQYAKGNALRGSGSGVGQAAIAAKVQQTISMFTAAFVERRKGLGHSSDEPIFIVGMPRSGSTLIEQILATHPAIEGTSELPVMPQLLHEIASDPPLPPGGVFDRIGRLDPAQLVDLGQRYLDRAAAFRHTQRPRFIDKMPGNWSNIGLIRLILPNARIIDARRHPLACGFSNFKQFYGTGAAFSYDLGSIGRHYREYLRLTNHFEQVDPCAIHRVVNESLIDDFESEVRALLDFVGVPFDPACLAFHANPRSVRTPSAEQVRRPINRDGVDQWRSVEPWLGPLKQALGPALAGWNAPPGTYRDEEE